MIRISVKKIDDELLDEAKEDDVFEKYKEQLESSQALKDEWMDFTNGWIAQDRPKRIKFLVWGTKWMIANKWRFENNEEDAMERMYGALSTFMKFSPQFKKKDINQYRSPQDIMDAYISDVASKRAAKAKKERAKAPEWSKDPSNSMALYEDDRFFMVRPFSVEGSCFFGKKTKWCIAQPGNSYYDSYTEREGKAFFFIKDDYKKEEDRFSKVAVEADEDNGIHQFWDRYDDPHDIDALYELEWPREAVDALMDAIQDNFNEYPPESGTYAELDNLDTEIQRGDYNIEYGGLGGSLHFYSYLEDYDQPFLDLNANLTIKLALPRIRRDLWTEADEFVDMYEAELIEEFTEISELEDYISYDGRHGDTDWCNMELYVPQSEKAESVILRLSMDLHEYESSTKYDASEVRSAIDDYKYQFEELDELREKIEKIFTEMFYGQLEGDPGVEKYREVFDDIEKIEQSYKHFYAIWEEDEPEAGISFVLQTKIPLQIPEIPKSLSGDSISRLIPRIGPPNSREQSEFVRRSVRRYAYLISQMKADIMDLIGNASSTYHDGTDERGELRKIFSRAIAKYTRAGYINATRQMQLDFGPNYENKPLAAEFEKVGPQGDDLFDKFSVKLPRSPEAEAVGIQAIMEFDVTKQLADIEYAMLYIKYLDNHWDEINASLKGELGELQLKINNIVKDLMPKFQTWAKGMARELEGEYDIQPAPGPQINENKRRKLKITVKKR